jgi:hypothetical protein
VGDPTPDHDSISGSTDEAADHRERYCVPRRLTPDGGRRAFHREVRDYAAELAEQLDLDAQSKGREEPEYTAHDVEQAATTIRTRTAERARGDTAAWATAAAVLVTLGTVGATVMSNHLDQDWQIVLFGLFALTGCVGLVLTWTSRRRRPPGT